MDALIFFTLLDNFEFFAEDDGSEEKKIDCNGENIHVCRQARALSLREIHCHRFRYY